MKKVLYIQPLHPAGMEFLKSKYEVFIADSEDREFLKSIIGDYNAVVTRLTEIDRELIECGHRLEAIAKHRVGTDNIDVGFADKKGIKIITTGDANSNSVAEHAVVALGALAKRVSYLNDAVRKGNWRARDEEGSVDLYGKIVGIIGFGRIGSRVARIMKHGFNMDVFIFDPFAARKDVEEKGYHYSAGVDELCKIADFLTVHIPLTDKTRNLLDYRRLSIMKPTAYVANFARGGVINEEALYIALKEKMIAGAAVDVFENEPVGKDYDLLSLDNILLSPHCAAFSEDARRKMSLAVARGIDEVFESTR